MNREFEMRLPVARWMLARGLSPICEVQCLGNCDLVGVRFEEKPVRLVEMVAVELKLRDIAGVLQQCKSHVWRGVTEVWAAMPTAFAKKHFGRFAPLGIGMLAVEPGAVVIVSLATVNESCDLSPWKNAMRRRRNEHLWRMQHDNMRRAGSKLTPAAAVR